MSRDLMTLRPYQRQAIDAVVKAWAGGTRRPAVVLPTGMGKTVVFSHLAVEHRQRTGKRGLVLVHRDELADQAVAKLRAVAPHLSVGKVKAEANQVGADVVVASVQTLAHAKRRMELFAHRSTLPPIGLVITDECHHAVAPSYGKVYADTPHADHVGFTATLARSDRIGLGTVWEDVAYSRSIAYAIKNGYLVRPRGRSVATDLDLSAVKMSRGDYQAGDLGDALESSSALETAADAYLAHAADRLGITFTPTVETAQHLAALLTARGIPSATISGATPRGERRAIYDAFRTGKVRVLSSCMVLTEGFDAPWASAAMILRPTTSQPLYVQMVGRVLRPFPGKTDALVIDVVGASTANRLTTLVDLEEGLWPEKKPCEECMCLPCACLCGDCGRPKPCSCPPRQQAQIVAVGSGEAFDLFASSRSAWNQTPRGVWFVSCGPAGYVFLWPSATTPENWDVCVAPLDELGRPLAFQYTQYRDMPLEAAMTWAEGEAEEHGANLADRKARWRRNPPSEVQLNLARRYGCVVPEGANKGVVSDLISTAKAAGIFDPFVGSA